MNSWTLTRRNALAEERPDWAWLDKVHCGDCLTLMGKDARLVHWLDRNESPLQFEEQHRQRIERRDVAVSGREPN